MFGETNDGIELPFTDAVLRLSPRWSELGDEWQTAALALCGVVPLLLVLWLYRYELRLISRFAALGLLLLRVAVIALLWFVVCLQPIVTSVTTAEVPTRVLVAVDVSGSMSVTDPLRPAVDKLKLARALDLDVPGGKATRKLMDDWIGQYEKKGQGAAPDDLDWLAKDEQPEDQGARRELIRKRRALHDQVSAAVDRLTRVEIALRLLSSKGSGLLDKLSEKHQVEVLGFDERPLELKPEQLDNILAVFQDLKPQGKEDGWELTPAQASRLFQLDLSDLTFLRTMIRDLREAKGPGEGRLTSGRFDKCLAVLGVVRAVHGTGKLTRKEAARYVRFNLAQLQRLEQQARAMRSQSAEPDAPLADDDVEKMVRQVDRKKPPRRGNGLQAKGPAAPNRPAETDLTPALERSLKPAGKDRGRLVGVVLLTDGRHNAPSSPARPAEKLGKRKVPILPVVVGTHFSRPSVTLMEVQAPARASSKNVEVRVRVRFKVTGLAKQNIVVTLERADRRPGQPKGPEPITVAHNGEDQVYERRFDVRMDPAGRPLQTYTVTVRPATKPKAGNLTQQFVIKLDDTKAKVLLVDGQARWEFHYLSNALVRDPSLKVTRVLFDPPLIDARNATSEYLKQMGNPQRELPQGKDALADFQCIVLGDVSPEDLPRIDRERLEQFVGKHGGTLVIVAGKLFTPLAYTKLRQPGKKGKEETDPLIKLLPIEDPRVLRPAKEDDPDLGLEITLTREGRLTSFLQMESRPSESLRRWASFPVHYWGIVGKAKPGATPLAYFRDLSQKEPEPLSAKARAEAELRKAREQGLIVRHTYGRGQVLFVGLDTTWRWRYRQGDKYHHRFWGQVIRWASSDYVRFGTDRPVYAEGEPVMVDLSLEDREAAAVRGKEIKVRIVRLPELGRRGRETRAERGETVALARLSSLEDLKVLKGQIPGLPAGRYRVELDKPPATLDLKMKGKPAPTFLITPRPNKEMDHLETDPDRLRDLARESGNRRLFTPTDAGGLVELLTARPPDRVERSEWGLWEEWGVLALFLGLLTVEWVGRKLAGLP
jgi:hypothetical protein